MVNFGPLSMVQPHPPDVGYCNFLFDPKVTGSKFGKSVRLEVTGISQGTLLSQV